MPSDTALDADPGAAPPRTLLVVDDEEDVLAILRQQLRQQPFRVLTASSASEALEIFEENMESVQVVLSDLRMPGTGGIEFLQQLRAKQPTVLRLVISSSTDSSKILDAVNSGHIYGYILKPWKKDDLIITLLQCFEFCEISRQRDELLLRAHRLNGQLLRLHHSIEKKFEERGEDLRNINLLIESLRAEHRAERILERLREVLNQTVGDRPFALYEEQGEEYTALAYSRPLFTGAVRVATAKVRPLLEKSSGFKTWAALFPKCASAQGAAFALRRESEPSGFLLVSNDDTAFPAALRERIHNLLPLVSLVLQYQGGLHPTTRRPD